MRGAPVAADTDVLVSRLRADVLGDWHHAAEVNAYRYNTSFYAAAPDQASVDVTFDDCQHKGYVPDGLYSGPAYFRGVPIPENPQPAQGTDAQLNIYDAAQDRLWEFWRVRKDDQGRWHACWGGRVDDVSTSRGVFPAPYGVTASGLVMSTGVNGIQEAARGDIDHAIALNVKDARRLVHSWPANRTDGRGVDPDLLAEGQRLRLDPSVDVGSLGLTPLGEAVARAAQRYGFIVTDLAGAVSISTESGEPDRVRQGLDPWNVLLGGPSYEALAGFPWDRVQALPRDWGAPADYEPVTEPVSSS